MTSTFTPNKSIEQPASGDYVNAWAAPINANWSDIDTALGGTTAISVTAVAAGTYTLTLTQYRPPNIEFTGVLTANLNYQIPAGIGGIWTISNATTGAFTLQFSIAAGNAITLPAGRVMIVSDGASISLAISSTSAGSFIPDADASYDLGSLSFRWRNLYLSGNSTINGSVTAQVGTFSGLSLGAFTQSPTQMVIKNSTTSRANTTTASADPNLQLSISSGTYSIEMWINDEGGTSPGGLKGSIGYSGSLTSIQSLWGMVGSGSTTTSVPLVTINVAAQQMQTSQGGVGNMWITGILYATGSGTISLNWAQQSSNGIASIVGVGSWMRVTKIS